MGLRFSDKMRLLIKADIDGNITSGSKRASSPKGKRRWDNTRDLVQHFRGTILFQIQMRYTTHESFGVRVQGIIQNLPYETFFHLISGIHDYHPVGHVCNGSHIVSDENYGSLPALLEFL